jgi:glycosyltransferase involved in cell wall biosynthesis
MRYVWDGSHEFVRTYPLPKFLKFFLPPFLKKMRIWDRLAADRVDFFLANSHLVQRRIKKYYQKDSEVLFPPVDLRKWQKKDLVRQDFYLAVGRMTPYKKFDLLIEAFNLNGKKLKIAGCGPMFEKLKSIAKPNIEFLGFVSDEKLRELYSEAKAFLFPQNEDFGVVPIEAMSCGAPVIAFRKGGALDTMIEGRTGVFFDEQDPESLNMALLFFDQCKFNEKQIIKHAQNFGQDVFQKKLLSFIEEKWSNFC